MIDTACTFQLAPIARQDARVLIIGSLPGESSTAAQRYYAHPGDFWRLIDRITGKGLAALDYDARIAALIESRIAIWDIMAPGARIDRFDHALEAESLRELSELVAELTELRVVAFNGPPAISIDTNWPPFNNVARIQLPSTNAASPHPFADKLRAWCQIGEFL